MSDEFPVNQTATTKDYRPFNFHKLSNKRNLNYLSFAFNSPHR